MKLFASLYLDEDVPILLELLRPMLIASGDF